MKILKLQLDYEENEEKKLQPQGNYVIALMESRHYWEKHRKSYHLEMIGR